MSASASCGTVLFLVLAVLGCGKAESDPAQEAAPLERLAWDEALSVAAEGRLAFNEDRDADAEAHLRAAVGILYRAGLLDDVPRGEVQKRGLERLDERLGAGSRLATRFRNLQPEVEEVFGRPSCALFGESDSVDRACVEESLRWLLGELQQRDLRLSPSSIDRVEATLEREAGQIRRGLVRGEAVVPMIQSSLEARHLSPLLHYLAFVESGYRGDALSHADAAGLWQFTRPTARSYGLRVDSTHDDRLDPAKATAAASDFLQDLALEFGGESIFLALAAYNSGSGRVRSALHELDDPFSDRSYWRLVERGLLPEETSNYVARFLAAALVGELAPTAP